MKDREKQAIYDIVSTVISRMDIPGQIERAVGAINLTVFPCSNCGHYTVARKVMNASRIDQDFYNESERRRFCMTNRQCLNCGKLFQPTSHRVEWEEIER